MNEPDRRGKVGRDDRAEFLLVPLNVRQHRLQKSLGMGRAQDDPGNQFAHRPVRKDERKIKNELLPCMADSGQVGILSESDVFIDFNVNLFFLHGASSPEIMVDSIFFQEEKNSNIKKIKKALYICIFLGIIEVAFLRGLEKAPTFLVPIINPPFADNSPHLSPFFLSPLQLHWGSSEGVTFQNSSLQTEKGKEKIVEF